MADTTATRKPPQTPSDGNQPPDSSASPPQTKNPGSFSTTYSTDPQDSMMTEDPPRHRTNPNQQKEPEPTTKEALITEAKGSVIANLKSLEMNRDLAEENLAKRLQFNGELFFLISLFLPDKNDACFQTAQKIQIGKQAKLKQFLFYLEEDHYKVVAYLEKNTTPTFESQNVGSVVETTPDNRTGGLRHKYFTTDYVFNLLQIAELLSSVGYTVTGYEKAEPTFRNWLMHSAVEVVGQTVSEKTFWKIHEADIRTLVERLKPLAINYLEDLIVAIKAGQNDISVGSEDLTPEIQEEVGDAAVANTFSKSSPSPDTSQADGGRDNGDPPDTPYPQQPSDTTPDEDSVQYELLTQAQVKHASWIVGFVISINPEKMEPLRSRLYELALEHLRREPANQVLTLVNATAIRTKVFKLNPS